ncbi:Lipid-A-disaccharide synthase [bacterium HR17]|uniref:Lipid-A-disaccharide synthase n=1 Tax=Candidatus Fervidibacter japonicus TaxID=2035412 RepID=A0A2H5X8K2_9BACT|nr:Lipid-A-disaccharide synthase [bacterium HR17]
MRVFFSVGDASGDLYAAAVVHHLQRLRPRWRYEGIGGVRLLRAGTHLWGITPAFSAFGAWSALRTGVTLWALLQRTRRRLLADPPTLFVPVDFGAFNRRLLTPLAARGVRVFYFVPPSFWGELPERLRRYVHPNIVFAPIYAWQREKLLQAGAQVLEFGHPLVDILAPMRALPPHEARQRCKLPDDRRVVSLFPGSRLMTVRENLPILLQVSHQLWRCDPTLQFALGLPPEWRSDWVAPLLARWGNRIPLSVHIGQSHELLRASDLALLVAGTVTLEAACLQTPSIAVFWTGFLNRLQVHWLRWRGVNVMELGPFALPNRILGDTVMPEFIGWAASVERLAATAWQLLTDEAHREQMRQRFADLWQRLGEPGACFRVAKFLVQWAEQ